MLRVSPGLGFGLLSVFAAISAPGAPITVAISGVAAPDVPALQEEFKKIEGVSSVEVRKLKGGEATLTVEFRGKGGDLALKLSGSASALKNVEEFDDASIRIAVGGSGSPAGKAASEEPAAKPSAPAGRGPAAAGAARRIPGGSAQTYQGVSFDVPKTWKVQAGDEGTALTPEGANPSGVVEEFYCIVHDPMILLDGEAFVTTIQRAPW